MVKTWQVAVLTFLVCSLVFTPIGLILSLYLYKRSKRLPNPEKLRKQYKMEWDSLV